MPSSTVPSQSSSTSLQTSRAVPMHVPFVHAGVHVRIPGVPHVVVQEPVWPRQEAKVSSHIILQLSSSPLQISAVVAGHVPFEQVAVQVRVPGPPHIVVQALVVPRQQANPLSHAPLQSSSIPLHISAGGMQAPAVHVKLQVEVPVDP